jgi:hypothetical protein
MAPPDGFLGGVIGPGLMEMLQKMIGAEEEDLVARAAGRVPQGAGEKCLADAHGAEDEGEEIADATAVEGDGRLPVNALERLLFLEASAAEAQEEVLVIPPFDLVVELHFNITEHPTAAWTAQQIVEAFPWDTAPRSLLRDRDGIYGHYFRRRVSGLSIDEVLIAARSPWQSPYVERLIGSLRRDCLEHVIVLNGRHLRRLLDSYLAYYHSVRTHLSLDKGCPQPLARAVARAGQGCCPTPGWRIAPSVCAARCLSHYVGFCHRLH